MGKAKTNPVAGVKLLPEHNLQIRAVSPEEETAYLAASSQPLGDVATLILETAMRPGEVFRLRKVDTDLNVSFVRISAGKTEFARRTIPLTQRAGEVLRAPLSPNRRGLRANLGRDHLLRARAKAKRQCDFYRVKYKSNLSLFKQFA